MATTMVTHWDDDERNTKVIAPCGKPTEEFVDMGNVLRQILVGTKETSNTIENEGDTDTIKWEDFDSPLYCTNKLPVQTQGDPINFQ